MLLTAYTHQDYHSTIFRVQEIIGKHGFITHFNLVSDLSVSFRIEIDAAHIGALCHDLQSVVQLEPADVESGQGEQIIYLQVNFSSGSGEKRHIIPAVPG